MKIRKVKNKEIYTYNGALSANKNPRVPRAWNLHRLIASSHALYNKECNKISLPQIFYKNASIFNQIENT